jgi:hypothetical protein
MTIEISVDDINEALLDEVRDLQRRLAHQRAAVKAVARERDALLQERQQLLVSMETSLPPSETSG